MLPTQTRIGETCVRVVIVGLKSLLMKTAADRLRKEGHEVQILATQRHRHGSVEREEVLDEQDAFFRLHCPEWVVYMPFAMGNDPAGILKEGHLNEMTRLLFLSSQNGCKRFLFISSAFVLTDVFGKTAETALLADDVEQGAGRSNLIEVMERVCLGWNSEADMHMQVVRVPLLYGPGLSAKRLADFLLQLQENRQGREALAGDHLHVSDVTEALCRILVHSPTETVIHLASDEVVDLEMVEQLLELFAAGKPEMCESKRLCPPLPAEPAVALAGWGVRHFLSTSLPEALEFWRTRDKVKRQEERVWRKHMRRLRPYLENGIIFSLLAIFAYANTYGGIIDLRLGVDYSFVYIGSMGMLYGKQQSIPAVFLSTILFLSQLYYRGMDVLTLLYQAEYLVHLTMYLLVGIVSGYVADNAMRKTQDWQVAMEHTQQRYESLRELYAESLRLKDSLASRVVNANDSLGRIYELIRRMDGLRREEMLTGAVDVFNRVMNTAAVAVHTLNEKEDFLRLAVRSKACGSLARNSLRVNEVDYAETVIERQQVYINRDIASDKPSMAAPLVYNGKVLGVVTLFGLPFSHMSAYHGELFRVTAMLVSDLVGRAHLFDQMLQQERSLGESGLLKAQEWERLRAEMKLRKTMYDQDYVVLTLAWPEEGGDIRLILQGAIRNEDYLGITDKGELAVLLANTSVALARQVQERLEIRGAKVLGMGD